MAERTCPRCKRTLPHTEEFFTRNKYGPGGFFSWCRSCKREYEKQRLLLKPAPKRLYPDGKGQMVSSGVRSHRRHRWEVLCHYGGSPPRCQCCGEATYEFLALDHVRGGGHQHRLAVGQRIYNLLRLAGFPPGYRVLCHNCNMALGLYGYCPHERTSPDTLATAEALPDPRWGAGTKG